MRALRAWHLSLNHYRNLFREIAQLSHEEMNTICPYPDGNAFDCTNRLTAMRMQLENAGYGREVKEADGKYLETHRGFSNEKRWEEFWNEYVSHHVVPEYPKDAL